MKSLNNIENTYEKLVKQPLLPLTLRVGVAGHRQLTSDQAKSIRERLKQIYKDIDQITDQLCQDTTAQAIYSPEPKIIRLISSLAEGADRLCLEKDLLPFKHQVGAILPFAQHEYEKDFLPSESVVDGRTGTVNEFRSYLNRTGFDVECNDNSGAQLIELDGAPDQRAIAYSRCSQVLVDHSDLLIAVYDGDQTEDKGTAATVNQAIERGIPIIHLSTLSEKSTALWEADFFGRGSQEKPLSKEDLRDELKKILLFSDLISNDTLIQKRFQRYGAEENVAYSLDTPVDFDCSGPITLQNELPNASAGAFRLFKKILTRKSRVASLENQFRFNPEPSGEKAVHNSIADRSTSTHRFFGVFLRADQLANLYANIHRSTFLLIYILATLALLTASLSLALKQHLGWVFSLILIELFLLGIIYHLYRKDHHFCFHDRWLEYRCLAEFLRPLIYLNLLGQSFTLFTRKNTPDFLSREMVGHQNSERRWLYIYIQTVIRWAGFSYCSLQPSYQDEIKRFIKRTWIKGQIDYHSHNAAIMQVLAKRLGSWSLRLFFATVGVVVAKLILVACELTLHLHFPAVLTTGIALCTAIFPILATTAFSIRNHAEFDISGQRSLTMRALLITHYNLLNNSTSECCSQELSTQLRKVASATTNEASEWLEIYEVKEAEPA